jgi:hypothetical protein
MPLASLKDLFRIFLEDMGLYASDVYPEIGIFFGFLFLSVVKFQEGCKNNLLS